MMPISALRLCAGFIAANNPPALREIASRFCEAVDRGLWAPRRNSAYDELQALAGRMAA
jgi:cobaltochelatase CobN